MKIVLNQVINIAASKQNTILGDLVNFSINLLALAALLTLSTYTGDRLMFVVILFGAVPVLVLAALSVWAFRGPYAQFKPSLKEVSWTKAKDIMNLGSKFFVIQIAGIIIFSTDNLIISHFIGPETVTGYHISFRYFGLLITIFAMLSVPIWPAYTEAYQQGDLQWIKKINKRFIKVWLFSLPVILIMFMVSPQVYSLWVGEEVIISWKLSAIMALYTATLTWGTIFVTFINSTGKLRMQTICSIIAGLINIPLSIFIIQHTSLGSAGVMLATIICLSYGPVVSVIQYKKLINGTAKGVWSQ
jgi:O-antigen/teichoic acid export membrane protein